MQIIILVQKLFLTKFMSKDKESLMLKEYYENFFLKFYILF